MEDALLELLKTAIVHQDATIGLPASNHTGQPTPCLADRVVTTTPKLLANLSQLATEAFGYRATLKRDLSALGGTPEVGQTEKVERLALAAVPAVSARRPSSKLNQTRFGRVQVQAELYHPLREGPQAFPGVRFVLETEHEVIRVADDDALAATAASPPPVEPQVQHVMQEDVRQQLKSSS